VKTVVKFTSTRTLVAERDDELVSYSLQ